VLTNGYNRPNGCYTALTVVSVGIGPLYAHVVSTGDAFISGYFDIAVLNHFVFVDFGYNCNF